MRLTRSNYIPWRDQLSLIEAESLQAYDEFDDLLEAVDPSADPSERAAVQAAIREMALEDGDTTPVMNMSPFKRVSVAPGNFQRGDASATKKAAASSWDNDFTRAQAHARDIIAKMGRR